MSQNVLTLKKTVKQKFKLKKEKVLKRGSKKKKLASSIGSKFKADTKMFTISQSIPLKKKKKVESLSCTKEERLMATFQTTHKSQLQRQRAMKITTFQKVQTTRLQSWLHYLITLNI
jgi:hypothetical protein